jgi:hypothetical protein
MAKSKFIETYKYKEMIEKHIGEICNFLSEYNSPEDGFSIMVKVEVIKFEPELPKSITNTFRDITIFTLMNYTFATIEVTDTHISFEAGFGRDNIGSVVTIPLFAILQILHNDNMIYFNPVASVQKFLDEKPKTLADGENQKERSMNAFKMNR